MILKLFMLCLISLFVDTGMCKANSRERRRNDSRQSDHKYMQTFGGYGGYKSQTVTAKSAKGEDEEEVSSKPSVSTELKVSMEYLYRVQSKLFAGPLLSMSNRTSGSGDQQRTENEFEPGVIAQYWFNEPNNKSLVPFVWGGLRLSNSSSGSGESKSSRSGLTYGGGAGGYLMMGENIAITPLFEYSMGNHNTSYGEYSSSASYSTMQLLLGLSFLK